MTTMSQTHSFPHMISGLVLTLSIDPELAASAIEALQTHPELELGEMADRWIPVTVCSGNTKAIHRWLEETPGIEMVDVAFVSTEQDINADGTDIVSESIEGVSQS